MNLRHLLHPAHEKKREERVVSLKTKIVRAESVNSFLLSSCCCSNCAISALCFLALVSHLALLIAVDSNVICQNFLFVVDEDSSGSRV